MQKTPTKNVQPPRWAKFLLQELCPVHLLEEIEGDFDEEFYYQIQHNGKRKARWDYIRNVIGFISPFPKKRKPSTSNTSNMNMLKHFGMVAIRNMVRHKSFSAINILGLSLAMTCCLLIFLWIQDEKQVDNFHTNGGSLYTVYQNFIVNEQLSSSYATPIFLSDEIKKTIPEVKYAVGYHAAYELPWGHPETFQVGDKIHKLEGARASEDFFKMFSYPVIAGDAKTALKGKSSLAISRKMASMFFENPADAIGKSIHFENRLDFTVTAVFEDLPSNSTLKFNYLVNWEIYLARNVDQASAIDRTFLQLQPDADIQGVEKKIRHLWDSHVPKDAAYKIELGLQRFGDQYLYGNLVNGKPDGGRIEYVRIFTAVAVFILIIACINFMNLATARSVKRAKEIGVRKVVGSSRLNLMYQFFGETMLLSFLSLTLALVLVHLLLPVFNSFTQKQISSPLTQPSSWMALISLMLATGFLAGSYPALFLSSLKPVRILKGAVKFTGSAIWFRKGLAVFQFSLSIVLLIATIVVSRQTNYVQNAHLGYDRENLIYIRVEGELTRKNKYLLFKEEASKMAGIGMVDRSSETPHAMAFGVADAINWEGKNKEMTVGMNNPNAVQFENSQGTAAVSFYPSSVGYDFLKLMDLKVGEGRGFSRERLSDSTAFMINETAVKQMGIKDPIGKWVSAWDKKGHIIGILKDYHIHSLHEPIKPVIIDVKEDLQFGMIMARTEPGKTKEALASLEKVYKTINPDYPFVYQFLDQEYENLYRKEQLISRLSNVFAFLAIAISCLGLLGLVMFSAEQRTKEIGIRKVLGATASHIVALLSGDFLKIVFISFIIAAPVAGYMMKSWLEGFAYKIPLAWWIFGVAGGVALMVALFTISVQALRSALANPVRSLRAE